MTKYEERVAAGTIVPMNGMDWLMLGAAIEGLLKGEDALDEQFVEVLEEMKDEIDHMHNDQPEILAKLNQLISEFKNKTNESN